MDTIKNQSMMICKCCQSELPLNAFYVNKRTNCLDKYCKECRKATSRGQYGSNKRVNCEKHTRLYPVITQIEDPVVRKALIASALEKVAESIKRKQAKLWEAADRDEEI